MKTRFSTIDILATISELKEKLLGMRVANVYDTDNRTYLIKLAKPDQKAVLLLESGNRFHLTEYEWPKNMFPSGFSMKLRKHLRTRRLENVEQLGVDRIIDFQFGSKEAAYHIILELYDRGNLVLTDHEYNILNILRPRTDESQDVKFAVREVYPLHTARQAAGLITKERLTSILLDAKEGDNLKKVLNSHLDYGPALIDHCIRGCGLPHNVCLGKDFRVTEDLGQLMSGLQEAEEIFERIMKQPVKGYIIQKREKKAQMKEGEKEELLVYEEFHPYLFKQSETSPYLELESFNKAVDEFFSKLEGQKLDLRTLHMEKAALKKLENVKKDHEKRLDNLQKEQDSDKKKATLIEMNLELVDHAIVIVRSAIANQIDWTEIHNLVQEAQAQGDPVAACIKSLKLDTNHITMLLKNPYSYVDSEEEEEDFIKPMKVDIDLSLSAYANARKYYDLKRHALSKELKTIDASEKAVKQVEKKTKQTLKEVASVATINKARKTYWFEKFVWFISSENYLVIGGRDQQQNELIVKRYLSPGDVYVHADLHGASSVVIKNHAGGEIPPKTLNEAGTMAVCNSAAWDAKVVTSAWWVKHDQVSKTAPSGEYLTTGSFMIRGKKNYLPPCYLVYGFGIMFKLDETSIFRHKDERKVRTIEDDSESVCAVDEMMTYDLESDDLESEEEKGDSATETADSEQTTSIEQTERTECTTVQNVEDIAESCTSTAPEQQHRAAGHLDQGQSCAAAAIPDSSSSSEDDKQSFPDTSIQLQHVRGQQFKLQRTISSTGSSTSQDSAGHTTDHLSQVHKGEQHQRFSAKERREMRKKKKSSVNGDGIDVADKVTNELPSIDKIPVGDKNAQQQQAPKHTKRGQKSKLKKIKEKYKDQDEEERELKMQILASSGSHKEEKEVKSKKNNHQNQQSKQNKSSNPNRQKGWITKKTLEDITVKVEAIVIEHEDKEKKCEVSSYNRQAADNDDGNESDEEKKAILEEENIQFSEDASIVDSLTGISMVEDILLFSIPVCAPYSVLTNYKYKVKLTPGNTKRGKAAKTALQIFLQDKAVSQREKDLLKSIKDTDLSRHFPGKVKVSAPNLQQIKYKKK